MTQQQNPFIPNFVSPLKILRRSVEWFCEQRIGISEEFTAIAAQILRSRQDNEGRAALLTFRFGEARHFFQLLNPFFESPQLGG